MTPEQQNRLNRQVNLGRDSGMRMRLTWEDGFSIVVHSWEAVSAIFGVSKRAMRERWYSDRISDGCACPNPNTGLRELCMFEELQKPRRGPPMDPSGKVLRERAYLNDRLRRAEQRVASIRAALAALPAPRGQG